MLRRIFGRTSVSGLLLCLLLAASIALSVITLWSTSQNLLDSDSSSEMVLAQHLYEKGGILSEDWYYSTEIRAFYTQLVFTPLFALFDDWSTVRFAGTVILHLVLLASYGCMVHAAGMKRKAFYIGGSLLLMPISVAYGRIVLYQVSYILCIAVGFLMTALVLYIMKDVRCKRFGWLALHTVILLALAFVSALNGYRQIAITQVPLALVAVIWMFQAKTRRDGMEAFVMLCASGAAAVAGLAGLVVNMGWHDVYTFVDYAGMRLVMISPTKLIGMLFGLLHPFGYRREMMLLTVTGLLSVMGAIVCVFCVLHGLRAVLSGAPRRTAGERVVEYLFPCAMSVVGLIFLLTRQNNYAELYFLPYAVWFIPMLSLVATTLPDRQSDECPKIPAWLTSQKLVVYALVGVCLLNGLINMRCFMRPEAFGQPYEGIEHMEPDTVAQMSGVRDYLVEEGYDLGYATFWRANVMAEMSDGKLKQVAVHIPEGEKELAHYDWLSLKSNRTMDAKKPYLLLGESELHLLQGTALEQAVRQAREIDGFVIFDIVDLPLWRELLER